MSNLNSTIARVVNGLPREFRKPVLEAAQNSEGSMIAFEMELASQNWDYPELDVQSILDKVKAID